MSKYAFNHPGAHSIIGSNLVHKIGDRTHPPQVVRKIRVVSTYLQIIGGSLINADAVTPWSRRRTLLGHDAG